MFIAPVWHTSLPPFLGRNFRLRRACYIPEAAEQSRGHKSPSTDTKAVWLQNRRMEKCYGDVDGDADYLDVKDSMEMLFVFVWLLRAHLGAPGRLLRRCVEPEQATAMSSSP